MELIAQRAYIGRDQPQIFRDERQTAQFSPHQLKELGPRARHPSAGLRRWCSGWHMPGSREAAEMI